MSMQKQIQKIVMISVKSTVHFSVLQAFLFYNCRDAFFFAYFSLEFFPKLLHFCVFSLMLYLHYINNSEIEDR